jgi:hypothetical protein
MQHNTLSNTIAALPASHPARRNSDLGALAVAYALGRFDPEAELDGILGNLARPFPAWILRSLERDGLVWAHNLTADESLPLSLDIRFRFHRGTYRLERGGFEATLVPPATPTVDAIRASAKLRGLLLGEDPSDATTRRIARLEGTVAYALGRIDDGGAALRKLEGAACTGITTLGGRARAAHIVMQLIPTLAGEAARNGELT